MLIYDRIVVVYTRTAVMIFYLWPPVYSEYSHTLLRYRSRVHVARLYYVYIAFSQESVLVPMRT
jgi:hypothetical protein